MTHYASCGHEILEDEEGNELYKMLSTKTSECGPDGFVNAVFYGSYCLDCIKSYESEGLILHTEQDELHWLNK
ncbi:hypothetical protein D3C85_392810 [compost metagenome]